MASPEQNVNTEPDTEYLVFFHWVVTSGWICGLDHHLEFLVNAHRTPGGTLAKEYYSNIKKHTPRYLVELYEAINCAGPTNAQEVMDMCDEYYQKGHWCHRFFLPYKDSIDNYIKSHKKHEQLAEKRNS